jgi:hypothetical protein
VDGHEVRFRFYFEQKFFMEAYPKVEVAEFHVCLIFGVIVGFVVKCIFKFIDEVLNSAFGEMTDFVIRGSISEDFGQVLY